MDYVHVQVRVGNAWVPAVNGEVTRSRGEEIIRAYKLTRPGSRLRLVPGKLEVKRD